MSNKPIKQFRSAAALGLSMGMWISEKGNPSFKIQKRYKDQESGEWKETQYFTSTDLAGLAELAQRGLAVAANHYEIRAKERASSEGAQQEIKPIAPKPFADSPLDDDDIPF